MAVSIALSPTAGLYINDKNALWHLLKHLLREWYADNMLLNFSVGEIWIIIQTCFSKYTFVKWPSIGLDLLWESSLQLGSSTYSGLKAIIR